MHPYLEVHTPIHAQNGLFFTCIDSAWLQLHYYKLKYTKKKTIDTSCFHQNFLLHTQKCKNKCINISVLSQSNFSCCPWVARIWQPTQHCAFLCVQARKGFSKLRSVLWQMIYSQLSLLDSAKITIMMDCSRNMAGLTKF